MTQAPYPNDPGQPLAAQPPVAQPLQPVSQPVTPQGPFPPAGPQMPFAPPVPPVPPKKKRGWLIALIIVVAVAVVGTGAYFGVRAVLGNRLTTYCKTYINLQDDIQASSDKMSAVGSGDQAGMSAALSEMTGYFQQLQAANPPETVVAPMDTMLGYFAQLQGYVDGTDTTDPNLWAISSDEFSAAGQAIDDATVAYCK
ncbi:MAG: hypothetical protein LBI33_12550 [Propionibacteriaceae bacterium]|jgi:hypothetical protein|nr:hypothetical protein [Propionibacteriaceae bacterium]